MADPTNTDFVILASAHVSLSALISVQLVKSGEAPSAYIRQRSHVAPLKVSRSVQFGTFSAVAG